MDSHLSLKYRIRDWIRKTWSNTAGFRLAELINERRPGWCWADLCMTIGLGYDILSWRKAADPSICRSDCERNGSCWCGKLMTPEFRAKREADALAGREPVETGPEQQKHS